MTLDATQQQYEKMTKTPVKKLIFMLAAPTIISMLVTNIYNVADTYFVSTLGTSASGATGIVFGLMNILQAFGFTLGHGAGSNISRRLGNHDLHSVRTFASTSFFLSLFIGGGIGLGGILFMDPLMRLLGSTSTILPFAREYGLFILLSGPAMVSGCVMNNILRYEGKAFYAMLGLTSGGILNIIGDAFAIHMGWGIAGIGCSTFISEYISLFILLLPFLQKKTQSRFAWKYFSTKRETAGNIFSTGMPSLARQGLTAVSTMVLNTFAGGYGDAAVAAVSIVSRILNFLFCVAIGIGQGMQPVAAFNYGAGLFSRVKKSFLTAYRYGTIIMMALGVVGYLFAPTLITIFRDDPEVIAIGTATLRYQCFTLWLMPITLYGNMMFQSIGESKIAFFLACLRSGLVLIPVLFLAANLYHLFGIEIAQAISEGISAIFTVPIILSFMRSLPADRVESTN